MNIWRLKRMKDEELKRMYHTFNSILEKHPDSEAIELRFYDIVTELVNRGYDEDNI